MCDWVKFLFMINRFYQLLVRSLSVSTVSVPLSESSSTRPLSSTVKSSSAKSPFSSFVMLVFSVNNLNSSSKASSDV